MAIGIVDLGDVTAVIGDPQPVVEDRGVAGNTASNTPAG
jgi:hypothetical protein